LFFFLKLNCTLKYTFWAQTDGLIVIVWGIIKVNIIYLFDFFNKHVYKL